MRTFKTPTFVLLGVLAWGTCIRADGPTKDSGKDSGPNGQMDQSPGWFARLFADDNQGPPWRVKAKKQKDRLEKERLDNEAAKKAAPKSGDRKSNESEAKEAGMRDQEAGVIKHEQAEYLRRLAVCDQLREIALKNNDEGLNRQADDLQTQAWAIYSKRVASISGAKAEPSGSRKASKADLSFPNDSDLVDAGNKEDKP